MDDHSVGGGFAHWISGVISSRIAERRAAVRVEIDIDRPTPMPVDPQAVSQLVRLLVDQAVDGMGGQGDLTITLWQHDGRLELELADTGSPIEQRPRRLPLLAAQLGAELRWQNCPQGGTAVTVCLDHPLRRRAAA